MTRKKKKKDPLGRVMAKVAKGKKLTKRDRSILSAARDAMNYPTRGKDPLSRAMSKAARGKELDHVDKTAISGAIDAVEPSKRTKKKKKKNSKRKN